MTYTFNPHDAETTIFAAVVEAARGHGMNKPILEDVERRPLTYGDLIVRSLVLGAKIVAGTRPGEAIGVLLPNVCAMPLAILGVNAFGRVPALLNFTAGPRNLVAAAHTAPVRRVVTSRRFVEAAKLEPTIKALAASEAESGGPIEIVYLEDIGRSVGILDKIAGFLRAKLAGFFHRRNADKARRAAVILFTSGTEGAPKGVVLTNANVVANALQIIDYGRDILFPTDTVLNPLPIFHSFGLTAGTLMPLIRGMKIVLHPQPLQYRQVAALARETRATILFAPDTFLQGYARAAEDGDFATLRLVIAGAERVKDQTRATWAKLGVTLLEGYGVTECAPVLCCNLPLDNRVGTVGRFLPGIEARLEPVEGIAEGGRLFVRGANVMAGYILAEDPGVVAPPADGWHDTGDIVTIDDGFVTIRGRAKRFAKIGGEMVSLAAVETLAADLWPGARCVAVTLPDPRKGEHLVLVTDQMGADKEALLSHARKAGFSELWAPKVIVVVGEIPALGSGKVDYAATRELARQARAAP